MKKNDNITKNILITGNPGVGKTALIRNIIKNLNISTGGFYTSEILDDDGKRWGFKIISLDGIEGIMASVEVLGKHRVSKYGVDIDTIDRIGVQAIKDAINSKEIIIIDEIGRMELFSSQFQKIILEALDSKKSVLGTISAKDTTHTKKIKEREDTKIIRLTKENSIEVNTYIERLFLRKKA